jgi:hypothetical protein
VLHYFVLFYSLNSKFDGKVKSLKFPRTKPAG